jgi:hypothetical protein
MASCIPAAVHALFDLYQATYPADTVWFGAELGTFATPTTIEINNVSGDQQPAELGPNYRREEVFSVACRITVFSGEGSDPIDFLNRMDDTYAVFNALEIAVANNPTLSGTVRFAECGQMDYEPTTDAKGMAMGHLTFVVRCSQRVTSLT